MLSGKGSIPSSGRAGSWIVTAISCIICGGAKVHYKFSLADQRVEECADCKLMRLSPQPTEEQLREIYGANYFILSDDPGGQELSLIHI